MPYRTFHGSFEHASKLGHVPLADSEFIKAKLASYRVFGQQSVERVTGDLLVSANDLPDPGEPVKWVMSFDGSNQELETRPEYPSNRVGYIQIAGVLVHLAEMLEQERQPFVDPAAVRRATQQSILSIVLPGSNVCRSDMETVRDSWRIEVYELLRDYRIEGQSILDVFLRLMEFGGRATNDGKVLLARCSADPDCIQKNILVGKSGGQCPACGGKLFPTDSLRIHEEVQELTGNGTALGRLMTVLEHLTMLCYIDYLAAVQPRALGAVAFVFDGPLALFGPPAPVKRAIQTYLHRLRDDLRAKHYRPPVIVGVEKTGQFAEHAAELGKHLELQTLMRLPDEYIFTRIIATRTPGSAFGEDTYYGRKFFYKTIRGQVLTLTVPYFDQSATVAVSHDLWNSETMPQTLALLDEIGTKLYQDALIPVALAHSYAAIPLRTGSKVLKLLSQEFLGQTTSAKGGLGS